MARIIDITGNTYNFLTVLGLDHIEPNTSNLNKGGRSFWKCKCRCGNEVILRKDAFAYPYSSHKSCGCWHREESSMRPKDKTTGQFVSLQKDCTVK